MEKIRKTIDQWREELTPERFAVCRMRGTESPFSGAFYHHTSPGTYHCGCCGAALFDSAAKYDSGSGWPSFFEPLAPDAVEERLDSSHGMLRMEVVCKRCEAHLGHVFDDGPAPSGRRYCVNSVCLDFRAGEDGPDS